MGEMLRFSTSTPEDLDFEDFANLDTEKLKLMSKNEKYGGLADRALTLKQNEADFAHLNEVLLAQAATKGSCGAKSSFCGKLKVSRLKTMPGVPTLDERIDDDVIPVMGKKQKHEISNESEMQFPGSKRKSLRTKKGHVFLEGGGQKSFSLRESSLTLFQRDYQQLYTFDGTKKLGVITVPSQIIPKCAINLFPEKLPEAYKAAKDNQMDELAKEVERALKADVIDVPVVNAFEGLKQAFGDSLW